MSLVTLYHMHRPLDEELTIGSLRALAESFSPCWIGLEPRAHVLERDGRPLTGRLPGLAPLLTALPDGLDDLPLLSAMFFAQRRWVYCHGAHPLSDIAARQIIWSLDDFAGARPIGNLTCRREPVFSWRDRARFGWANDNWDLPETMTVEHFFQGARRIAWRLVAPLEDENP